MNYKVGDIIEIKINKSNRQYLMAKGVDVGTYKIQEITSDGISTIEDQYANNIKYQIDLKRVFPQFSMGAATLDAAPSLRRMTATDNLYTSSAAGVSDGRGGKKRKSKKRKSKKRKSKKRKSKNRKTKRRR